MRVEVDKINPLALPAMPLAERSCLPSCPAIYFVIADDKILYIGQTVNLTQRWATHHTRSYLQSLSSNVRVAWLECRDKELLRKIETVLIEQFEPELNGNPRGTVKLSIYLPEEMRANFKSACALHRKSMNQVLVDYISNFLEESKSSSVKSAEDKGAA